MILKKIVHTCLIMELEDSRTKTYLVVGSLTTDKVTLAPGAVTMLTLLRKSSCPVITEWAPRAWHRTLCLVGGRDWLTPHCSFRVQ